MRGLANINARVLNKVIIPVFRTFKKNDHNVVTYAFVLQFFERQLKENIFPLKTISFENIKFNCPANVDGYLKCLYADWTQIPKEEDIKTHNVKLQFLK